MSKSAYSDREADKILWSDVERGQAHDKERAGEVAKAIVAIRNLDTKGLRHGIELVGDEYVRHAEGPRYPGQIEEVVLIVVIPYDVVPVVGPDVVVEAVVVAEGEYIPQASRPPNIQSEPVPPSR